jgi:hypothetical protein
MKNVVGYIPLIAADKRKRSTKQRLRYQKHNEKHKTLKMMTEMTKFATAYCKIVTCTTVSRLLSLSVPLKHSVCGISTVTA